MVVDLQQDTLPEHPLLKHISRILTDEYPLSKHISRILTDERPLSKHISRAPADAGAQKHYHIAVETRPT